MPPLLLRTPSTYPFSIHPISQGASSGSLLLSPRPCLYSSPFVLHSDLTPPAPRKGPSLSHCPLLFKPFISTSPLPVWALKQRSSTSLIQLLYPPPISSTANGTQKRVSPDLIFSSSYHCVPGTALELQKPSRGSPAEPSFSEVQNYTVWRATRKLCGPMSGSEHIENINSHFLSYMLTVHVDGEQNKNKNTTTSVSLHHHIRCTLVHPFISPHSPLSSAALATLS